MLRRTKIVATLGPASESKAVIDDMIEAGLDVVRLNFSHGNAEDHIARAALVRERAAVNGRPIGVLVDLQGPKIRIDRFKDGKIELVEGEQFVLDIHHDPLNGTQERVGVTYKKLADDVSRGDTLLLDDGRVTLWVEEVVDGEVRCQVVLGGALSNNKGINRQGGGLSADAITQKDREDIKTAAKIQADYVAISFPRCAADVNLARQLLREAGGHGSIVSKIERAEAVDDLEAIVAASDVVMVARGDLGVEIGDAELPAVQKKIIKMARSMDTIAITATQMMESMIESPIPTRAEVFDVANAVLDGTDAVMLSAETAAGKYPAKAVAAMDRVCRRAEHQPLAKVSDHRINTQFERVDEAIAMATMYTANHVGVKAIAALTESGSTPLWMSRISSGIPIYALTPHIKTQQKVTLFRGVYPVKFEISTTDHALANKKAVAELVHRGVVRDGDLVIIAKGDLVGCGGGTNAMKIVRVGDMVEPQ
ncbi:MAG: pyruvate kinase [Gammaproteobacteria bacterium]|nr:pyruvate kinase [Gammaproteobacteria bacterium]